LAYFLIAVLVPFIQLRRAGEKGNWNRMGAILSLVAGGVGALGALGVIFALRSGGKPIYVMPLVFGGAPVVNTIVTMWLSGTFRKVNPIFLVGVVTVVLGAAGVLVFRPSHAPPAGAAVVAPNYNLVYGAIATAVLCWGAYGPVLHVGQSRMGGSRLRPFLCVGIAYFIIAVALPILLLQVGPLVEILREGKGMWNQRGTLWSLAGGAAGALGALGIILAFTFGGRPVFVMPLVFGLAPVMNSLTTIASSGTWHEIDYRFVIALLLTIVGAVTVLIYAPKPAGKPPSDPPKTPS
jgi:hypothetical protein